VQVKLSAQLKYIADHGKYFDLIKWKTMRLDMILGVLNRIVETLGIIIDRYLKERPRKREK